MIGLGTLLNALAILVGGLAGRALSRHLTPERQQILKILMGVFVVYAGLSTTWQALHAPFWHFMKQLGIVLLSMTLGKLIGQALRLQAGLNALGQYARDRFDRSQSTSPSGVAEGFVTCTVLFCVGPMAILGAIQDGLNGSIKTLAVKALMDGLATTAFVTTFGWGVLLSIIPVVAYQGTITLLARALAPYLQDQALLDSVNATGGMLIFCIALLILDIKRVNLADYLPSLAVAPLLTWLWK